MKLINILTKQLVLLGTIILIFSSCDLENEPEPTPTKTLMEGTWEVTEAYDSSGTDILDKLKVLKAIPSGGIPPFFHLSSDNGLISTAGPMTSYIVYNETFLSNLFSITAKIDQLFDYFTLSFDGGEWFIANGVVDRFTLEMKLEGVTGTSTLVEILNTFGVQPAWLETLKKVVYHRYKKVKISFQDTSNNIMVWELDDQTTSVYNWKNFEGDPFLWQGWEFPFAKCKFVLTKRSKDLQTLVTDLQ